MKDDNVYEIHIVDSNSFIYMDNSYHTMRELTKCTLQIPNSKKFRMAQH
jgi:hypothetical protein